jgi:hypothetical protein
MTSTTTNRWGAAIITVFALAYPLSSTRAQTSAGTNDFVSRQEYNQLLQKYEQLQKQMQTVLDKLDKPQPTAPAQPAVPPTAPAGFVSQAAFDDLKKEVEANHTLTRSVIPGSSRLNIAGYGAAGFVYQQNDGDRKFIAQFNPLFLWKLSDKLFFEGEVELELEDGDTHAGLEQAHLAYVANDFVTFDAGKFLNPMDAFVERFHMAWVNRLPDHPLAVYDGLLPETILGAQARGGIPIGSTRLNYSAFAGNAPSLNTDPGQVAYSDLGTLNFDNFDNVDGQFIGGGHIGFQPIPALEIGYGIMGGNVGPSGTSVSALWQSVDLNYVRDSELLRGLIRVNAQWVWSHVGTYPYPASAEEDAGTFWFNNNRNGGYAQITYRPTKWNSPWLAHLEPVFRYDMLNQKQTPSGFDEWRYTLGLNYWLGPMTVLKAAFQFDQRDGDQAHNAILLQFATGL